MFYHNLMRTRFQWPWAPFGIVLALLCYWGLSGDLSPGLPLVLLLGALMATWWLGQSLWAPAVVLALLLLPTGLHFAWQLPVAEKFLRGQPPRSFVRIAGTIRRQERLSFGAEPVMRLLLGEVSVEIPGQRLKLAELELDLPVDRPWWGYRGRREIRAGGKLAALSRVDGRLRLRLDDPEFHMTTPALGSWSPEYLRAALRARASYYLGDSALAVYLPILLGVRERGSPAARDVVAVFRRTGAAHLFAISGLHVGLLYLLFMLAAHHGTGWLLRGQGVLYLREATQIGVIVLLWGYLALIGFPVTAVRAAVMGSALVWADLWGSRTPRVHVLALAALMLLAWAPSQIYDLSFQMSFLAYWSLMYALGPSVWIPQPAVSRLGRGLWRLRRLVLMNLTITLFITLALWPLISVVFGTVSLLSFAANLLMIPLLSVVVLPMGLWCLLVSMMHLGALPGAVLERFSFAVLEVVINAWVAVIRLIDAWGGALVLSYRLDWPPTLVFGYYALITGAIVMWSHRRRMRLRKSIVSPAPAHTRAGME